MAVFDLLLLPCDHQLHDLTVTGIDWDNNAQHWAVPVSHLTMQIWIRGYRAQICLIMAIAAIYPICTAIIRYDLVVSNDGLHVLLPVIIGTPPQYINLILDTASSELSIFEQDHICGQGSCFNRNHSLSIYNQNMAQGADRATLNLLIDGVTVTDSGRSSVEMDIISIVNESSVPDVPVLFLLVSDLKFLRSGIPDTFHEFRYSQGLLGLSYESLAAYSCWKPEYKSCTPFQQLVRFNATYRPIFSLNFGRQPQLAIGGIEDSYKSSIQWSTSSPTPTPYFHRFSIFQLSICGIDLFSNYTTEWEGIIDTGASCLSLPFEFFDMVCTEKPVFSGNSGSKSESLTDGNYVETCYIPEDMVDSLPYISFTVNEQGNSLYLPLKSLLINHQQHNKTDRRLCIYKDKPIDDYDESGSRRRISFGTLAVSAFYMAFDMQNTRVGLANQHYINDSGPMDSCSAPIKCQGQQERWIAMNTCLDPVCSGYIVRHFDSHTKTCIFYPAAEIIIYTAIGTLFMAEIAAHFFYRFQCVKVLNSTPSY